MMLSAPGSPGGGAAEEVRSQCAAPTHSSASHGWLTWRIREA